MARMHITRHIVTYRNGLGSWAVTTTAGLYVGAINEMENGRFEALKPGQALDSEPTFETADEAEAYLQGETERHKP